MFSLQSCPTRDGAMDHSSPDSSVHGIFQARILEWGAISFSILGAKSCQFVYSQEIIFSEQTRNEAPCLIDQKFSPFWFYFVYLLKEVFLKSESSLQHQDKVKH